MANMEFLGFDERGAGRALVLVHGFPFDARQWTRQLDGLADIRRVIAVDLRGRRKSGHLPVAGCRIDTHADDIARLLDTLHLDKVDLGGLSMGGYTAMAFWRRHAARVRSLLFMDTRAAADTAEGKQNRVDTANLVRAEGTTALIPTMLPRLITATAPAEVTKLVIDMITATPRETAASDSMAMRDRPDSTAMLESISVPTLVLHGEADVPAPVALAREMAAAIPRSTLATIPAAGHLAPLEKSAEANAAIRAFLTQLDA